MTAKSISARAGLLTEWFAPAAGLDVDADAYGAAWDRVLPIAEQDAAPVVTVLRDYHAENIMLLPDVNRSRGLGLLDFQDALAGHPGYDLVSLLQDARRDVTPAVEQAMLARYIAAAPVSADFLAAYAVLGAQRNAKIIGIFTRLWKRDGKPRYLGFLPRMWGLLERDLAHPALAPLATGSRQCPCRGARDARSGMSTILETANADVRRARQADAAADGNAAQAADQGGGSGADRPCARPDRGSRHSPHHRQCPLSRRCHRGASSDSRQADGAEYIVSDERDLLLETGGGLVKALPLLGDKPFLCANSDNLWINGPVDSIRALGHRWDDNAMDALLLMVPHARATGHKGPGDFRMDPYGRLTRRRPGRIAPFVFTGVQILSPRLIADPPGAVFSTNIFWDRAIATHRAFGLTHPGLWFDVGTPEAIPLVEAGITGG